MACCPCCVTAGPLLSADSLEPSNAMADAPLCTSSVLYCSTSPHCPQRPTDGVILHFICCQVAPSVRFVCYRLIVR